MKLQVFRGSISSIPYFQTPQVFLCSLTTLVTRASRNDMVMRRPSQKLWVPEAHFLLKLVGKSCQPCLKQPETLKPGNLNPNWLWLYCGLWMMFFFEGRFTHHHQKIQKHIHFQKDEARCLANSGKPLAVTQKEAWTGAPVRMPYGAERGGLTPPSVMGIFLRDQWWNDDTLYSIDDPMLKWLSWNVLNFLK